MAVGRTARETRNEAILLKLLRQVDMRSEPAVQNLNPARLVRRLFGAIRTSFNQSEQPTPTAGPVTYLLCLLPGLVLFGLGTWPLLGAELAPMPWLTGLTEPTGMGAQVDTWFHAGFALCGAMLVSAVLIRPFAALALILVLGRLTIERGTGIAIGEALIAVAILLLVRGIGRTR